MTAVLPEPAATAASQPDESRARPLRGKFVVVGAFVAGVLVGAGAFAVADARQDAAAQEAEAAAREAEAVALQAAIDAEEEAHNAVLEDAVRACGLTGKAAASLGDEGATLTIDHKGEDEYTGISYTALQCVLRELDTPDAVLSRMGQTTSMDGRQTGEWDGISASWSYHPDRGMDTVFTLD